MEKKFTLQTSLFWPYFLIYTFLILLFIGVSILIGGDFYFKITIVAFLLHVLLSKHLFEGSIEITINKGGLQVNWIKQPLLLFKGKNYSIDWNKLDSYKFYYHRHNPLMRLFCNEKKYLLYIKRADEQFSLFLHEFENQIESFNQKKASKIIEEKKTFQDTFFYLERYPIFGGLVLLIGIVSLFINIIFLPFSVCLILFGIYIVIVRMFFYNKPHPRPYDFL